MTFLIGVSFSVAVLLFLISSFFASAETALTAFSRPRIHRLAKRGNLKAKRVEDLSKQMNNAVGSILIGKNVMDILATSLITTVFMQLFDETGMIIATMVLTFVVIVFLEVLPKMYAITYPETLALAIGWTIQKCVTVLTPLMYIVQIISEKTLSLLGMSISRTESWPSAIEELRSAIDLHGKERLKNETHMLHSVLDLASLTVEEIMIHRSDVQMIDIEQPLQAIHDQILKSPYTRLPVWKNSPENILGILNVKTFLNEYLKAKAHKKEEFELKKALIKPWFIPETTPLLHQMHAFRSKRSHLAIVIDEYGSFSGIVTLEDILEEIVGEIDDEHDIKSMNIRPTKDGAYLMEGIVTLRDINKQFDLEIPDEEMSTLAGLLIHESQAIPEVGQKFHFYGITFTIIRREENQITLVRVELPQKK
ncbi:MAG: HlyC/CorC family transporter [Alphaproteobacteria bacterium]